MAATRATAGPHAVALVWVKNGATPHLDPLGMVDTSNAAMMMSAASPGAVLAPAPFRRPASLQWFDNACHRLKEANACR
jgi:hypothetical protein